MVNTGPFGEDQLLLLSHSGAVLPGVGLRGPRVLGARGQARRGDLHRLHGEVLLARCRHLVQHSGPSHRRQRARLHIAQEQLHRHGRAIVRAALIEHRNAHGDRCALRHRLLIRVRPGPEAEEVRLLADGHELQRHGHLRVVDLVALGHHLQAVGADLEIRAVFPDGRAVKITQFSE